MNFNSELVNFYWLLIRILLLFNQLKNGVMSNELLELPILRLQCLFKGFSLLLRAQTLRKKSKTKAFNTEYHHWNLNAARMLCSIRSNKDPVTQ